VIPVIPQAFAQVLFTRVARSEHRTAAVVSAYARALVVTAMAAAVAIIAIPWLVPLIYGRGFAAAVVPAMVTVGGTVLGAGAQVLQGAARGSMRVRVCVEAEVAAILVAAAAAWPMTRLLGLVGISLCFVLGRATSLGWMAFRAPPLLGVPRLALLPWSAEFSESLRADWRYLAGLLRRPAASPASSAEAR